MYEYNGVLYNMNSFVKFSKNYVDPKYTQQPYEIHAHTSHDIRHDAVVIFKFATAAERDEFWKWLQD